MCSISPIKPAPPPAPANVANTQVALRLAGLQRSYETALKAGTSPQALSGMAKQIYAAAQQLGLNVALPTGAAHAAPGGGNVIDVQT